jgi:hypothetical protein
VTRRARDVPSVGTRSEYGGDGAVEVAYVDDLDGEGVAAEVVLDVEPVVLGAAGAREAGAAAARSLVLMPPTVVSDRGG